MTGHVTCVLGQGI